MTRSRARLAARHIVLGVGVAGARAVSAQAVTLPTVRLGGPPVEEQRFFRVVRALRAELAPDTLRLKDELARAASAPALRSADTAATARATRDTVALALALDRARLRTPRYGPKLDSLVLAALDGDQPDLLDRARTHEETLRALAGDKYDLEDPTVGALYAALTIYARDTRARSAGAGAERVPIPRIRERDARRLLRGARNDPTLTAEQQAQVDTLTRLAVALIILRKFDERDGFAPVRNRAQAEVFWAQQGLAPLSVGAIAASQNSSVAFTELAAPILHFLRVSVNAVLAAKKDDAAKPATAADNEAAVQRLATGGGLVNLAFAWPAVHFQDAPNEKSVSLLVVPRLGFTSPQLGAQQADSTTLNLDSGVELHGKFLDLAGGVGLVGQVRWAYAVGSRRFGESLGLSSDRVGYATAAFGFAFARRYMVTFSRVVGGPRVIRKPDWTVGLTAVRMPTL